jgi:hypothetical protein
LQLSLNFCDATLDELVLREIRLKTASAQHAFADGSVSGHVSCAQVE